MLFEADFELLLPLADADDDDPTLCWSQVFNNDRPVEIEIGLGKGRFLIDSAQRHPEINFVGVEWAAKYLRLAHARSVKLQLYNMRYVRADAREFVDFFVPSASIQAYHIYFPDPWPKKKHRKRRLFNEEFLHEVEHTLELGGLLWLATDFVDYYEAMLMVLEGSERMVEVDVEWEGVRTNYEDKYVAQGKPIYRRVMQLCR